MVRVNRREPGRKASSPPVMHDPFRYFNSAPEVIRLAVMMYVRSPLSLRQIEDLLCERGIDLCHETVRYWWHRVGPLCAAEIRTRRVHHRCYSLWRWHLDEGRHLGVDGVGLAGGAACTAVRVRINGKTHSRWRAVDHEGEVVEGVVTKRRDRRAALEFLQRAAEGIVKLAKSESIAPQATGPEPVVNPLMLGIRNGRHPQLDNTD